MSRHAAPLPDVAHTAAPKQDPDAKQNPDQKKDADATNADSQGSDQVAGDSKVTLDPAAVKNAGITLETVRSASRVTSLMVPGTIEAATGGVAKVTPPVAGKVTRLLVGLGDLVRVGQPLAVLDSPDVAQAQAAVRQADAEARQAAARVQTAQAQVEQAQDRARSAQAALRRETALARAGAFSQSPLQAARSEQSQAQAELLQAQTDLQNRVAIAKRNAALYADGIVARAALEQTQIDQRQVEIRVDQAQARVRLAQQTLTREQSVYTQDLMTLQATQPIQAEVRAAQGEVRRTKSETQGAQTALVGARGAADAARASLRAVLGQGHAGADGQITLLAPLSGTVTQRVATLGEAVERSSTLLVIENLATITAQANVGEQDVSRVRVGQPVTVTVASYQDKQFAGVVQGLGSDLDPKTRTLPVRCLVENQSGRLRPEMFAQIMIATDAARPVVTLPSAALVADGDQRFVYVADGDGYRKRPVKVRGASGSRVEVRSGLGDGERVVTNGAFVLHSEANKGALGDKD